MIEAVIFDMDGVLIDSEPFWKEAEKHVFSSLGVDVKEEFSFLTASMTTQEVTRFWYQLYPWVGRSLAQVEADVIRHVEKQILEKGVPMQGVKEILDFFKANNIEIGLATNSPFRLISLVLRKLGIGPYFKAISSSEMEKKGKPHPAVYLSTARKLNASPTRCIAFEDSLTGVVAAQAAGIKVVAVPPVDEYPDNKFDISDMKIKRLSDFTDVYLQAMSSSL